MPLDALVLGSFLFTGFAVPDTLPDGGKHQLIVHKLPCGARIIAAMGPDDDRQFTVVHVGSQAQAEVQTHDQMRISGRPSAAVYNSTGTGYGATQRHGIILDTGRTDHVLTADNMLNDNLSGGL